MAASASGFGSPDEAVVAAELQAPIHAPQMTRAQTRFGTDDIAAYVNVDELCVQRN
jgi:hypothetical protein